MYEIDKENTALSKLGLSYDTIMQEGERIEIDPVAKVARKEKYIEFALANQIKDAYADDLEDAYRAVEATAKENEDLKAEIENYQSINKNKTAQLKKVLSGENAFKEAETLLAQLDQQMEMFEQSKKQDRATIQKLQEAITSTQDELSATKEKLLLLNADVTELEQLRGEIPKMRDEVQRIIDSFVSNLKEAGIDIDND